MKKLLAAALAFALCVIPLTACGGNADESSHTNSEYITSSSGTSDALSTMSAEEYRELNKFFDPFIVTYIYLHDITTEFDVVNLSRFVAELDVDPPEAEHNGEMRYYIPKEAVEKTAKKYFDVDEINHENFKKDHEAGTYIGFKDGYYIENSDFGGGIYPFCYNVSSLTNNFDGTYTAEVYQYYTWGYEPDNKYDKESNWKLVPNQRIIDDDTKNDNEEPNDVDIYKSHMATLTLKPYQGSWQIVQINDFAIPKKLLF
jgi:hypothetical protein